MVLLPRKPISVTVMMENTYFHQHPCTGPSGNTQTLVLENFLAGFDTPSHVHAYFKLLCRVTSVVDGAQSSFTSGSESALDALMMSSKVGCISKGSLSTDVTRYGTGHWVVVAYGVSYLT